MRFELKRLSLIDDEDILLDEAALQLALLDHPDIDLAPYQQILSAITIRLEEVSREAASPRDQADALALVFSGEYGFVGDSQTYDDAANADLIRVIDRRRGLPVSLSILYVAAARRLGWPAHVLNVPGHVLVAIGEATEPVVVDPFRGGIFVSQDQLMALLSHSAPEPGTASYRIAAMPNRAVLARLLLNQATRAEEGGSRGRALELYRRITAFDPENGRAWWDRARLELVEQNVPEAKGSLTAMLEITREPTLRATIVEMLEALATR